MIKFQTLLTQPIIVVSIGTTCNFDRWKWAALSNTMRVEVFKPNMTYFQASVTLDVTTLNVSIVSNAYHEDGHSKKKLIIQV
jgi:hypothetical protein